MGMFDSIQCNCTLPLPLEVIDVMPDIYDQEFQTKDMECLMDLYILDAQGRLQKEERISHWVDDDSYFLKGYFDSTCEKTLDTNFHGVINFYIYARVYDDKDEKSGKDVSIDFMSKFTNGVLDYVEVQSFEILDATDTINSIKEMHENWEKIRNLWHNKYFFDTKLIRFFRKKIIKAVYKLHTCTGKLHTLAIRHI